MILMESGTYYLSSTLAIPANVIIDGSYNVGVNNNWYKATNTPTNIVINPALSAVTPIRSAYSRCLCGHDGHR